MSPDYELSQSFCQLPDFNTLSCAFLAEATNAARSFMENVILLQDVLFLPRHHLCAVLLHLILIWKSTTSRDDLSRYEEVFGDGQ